MAALEEITMDVNELIESWHTNKATIPNINERIRKIVSEVEKSIYPTTDIIETKEQQSLYQEKCMQVLKILKKLHSHTDTYTLAELLQRTYQEHEDKKIRIEAGKILGYKRIKIWEHEHPTQATSAKISVTIAAIGIGFLGGYYIMEFIDKLIH